MKKIRGSSLFPACLAISLLCPAQAPKPSQAPAPAPAANANPARPEHALTQPDLEAFFDGIVPLQLERSDIAGATVLVMQDGKVLLQKGYGYADLKSKKHVDPNATIFRLASISKLFTWVAVMQLQEQGKLNLDTDINQYLDFQIRPAFNKPISLRNLMTHTGGFEEVLNNIIVVDPKQALSLRDDLIQNQPKRLFPPGEVPAYSNYGVGLASYIVQRASGEPFEQYVHEHIFAPLGMTHSSFYQPLEKSLTSLPSEGYRSNTTKPPVGFEMLNPVGAGGLSSTASDMARFGQALLNGGELDSQRILKPETLAQMWTPQFRASDQLPPLCMGFYQVWRNKLHWIGHEGDLIAFHSLFFVEPQNKLVLFVSYNSAGSGSNARPEIINLFSDRYFPAREKAAFLNSWDARLRDLAGVYQTTRRADSTKLKLMSLLSQSNAEVDKDGTLKVDTFKDLRGHTIKWRPVGKDLWQRVDGQKRVFAIRDNHNKVVRLAFDFPGAQLERVPWYENGVLVGCVAFASLTILVFVVLATLFRAGHRIFFRKRRRLEPQPGTLRLTLGPRVAAFLWCILLGSIVGYMLAAGDNLMPPTPLWFKWFVLLNWATGVTLFFSFFAILAGIRAWRRSPLRWISKVKFTLVSLACLILSWIAIHWNLIGPAHRI